MAMTDYRAVDEVGVDPYAVDDTIPQFPLGCIVRLKSPSLGYAEAVYLKGVASCAEGSFVTYRPKDHTAILLAANAIGAAGIALGAASAATKFGWFIVRGRGVGKVAAAFADAGLVYATATAGTADDAVVAGDRVKNALGSSAIDTPATGFAYIDLYPYPFMDDATAA